MNKRLMIPIVLLAAFLVVPVMAAPAEHSVTGGGWALDKYGYKIIFGANADSNLKGTVEYNVVGVGMMHSTGITYFNIIGTTRVEIMGTCRIKDAKTNVWFDGTFVMEFFDYGEPGTGIDYVRLALFVSPYGMVYDSGYMLLSGGNIQIR